MNIRYYLTTLPPKMPDCDAVVQEVEALRAHWGGDLVYLNPNIHLPFRLPRKAFGLHRLKALRAKDADVQIHHLFNPDLFVFPALRGLRRPIVYSLTGGVRDKRPNVAYFESLAAITVTDARSLARLRSWGLNNSHLVHPGIDTSRFARSPIPLGSEVRLMVGSAPWTRAQFKKKGVDVLLAAAQRSPRLHLVFLWRGVLAGEMERRVRRMNLESQVELLNRKVDVNQVLAGVHASVSLATDPAIIRPYPHSLMESLVAGKPIIVSRSITMADYVERVGCGKVVGHVNPASVVGAVDALVREYGDLQAAAQRVGQRDFSQRAMIASFQRVYAHILEPGK